MSDDKFKKEEHCHTYIFAGSFSDLSKIDFSFLGLKSINIKNEKELLEYFTKFSIDDWAERNIENIRRIKKDFWDNERMYLITPIDFNKIIDDEIYFDCWRALGVLFPSDIQIVNELDFQVFDNKYISNPAYATWTFHSSGTGNMYENFLWYDENNLSDINQFIKLFFERYPKISYIKTVIPNYTASFTERYRHLSFISLCMCLEAIVDGSNELSYRIRRNLAVLCGDNELHAEKIFNNVKKIYTLRSKIVHGVDYDYRKLEQYFPYLKVLVSRMIIELILHNIPNLNKLNEKLNKLGFGQKQLISDGYQSLQPNLNSYVALITGKLD